MMVVASALWGGVQGGYDDGGEVSALAAAAAGGGEQDYKLFIDFFRLSLFIRCWPIDDHSRTKHGA